jgi:O-antigen/teichoic acid export membrane protein
MTESDGFARFAGTDAVLANLKRKSVRGAAFVALGGAGDFVLRLGAIAILARLLSPEDFGLVAMVTAVTAVLDGFRDLGLGMATVQHQEITQRQATHLFWVNAVGGMAFALVLCVFSPLIAGFYRDDRLVALTIAMSLTFVWGGLSVQHEALMSRQLKQSQLATIRLAASALSIVVGVALALRGWGYWALVWREVVRSALVVGGVWLGCPWLPGRPGRGAEAGALIRFGRDLTFANLLVALITNIDRLLIGRYFGPSAVGLYRQAQQLLMAPIDQLNAPLIAVAQPALSALQREPDRYRRYYEKIASLVALATVPVGLFVAVYATEVTALVLGPAWSEAAALIRIFGVAAAIRPAVGTSAIVLMTCGQSARYLWIAVAHSVVLVSALVVGIRWGAEGAAFAHVATTVVLLVPKLYYSFLRTPVRSAVFLRAVRNPAIAGAVMAACLIALRAAIPTTGVLTSLLVGSTVGSILYPAVWLLLPGGREQARALVLDVNGALRGGPARRLAKSGGGGLHEP